VPGAAVSAEDPRWEASFSDLISEDLPTPNPCLGLPLSTDAQGRFTLELLRPGRYDVWATATGYRKSRSGRHLDLGLGEELTGVEVQLVPGAVVRGRVTTAKGDPVDGARVSTPDDNASTLTDARGAYRLTGVSPGWHGFEVEVHEDGILSRTRWQGIKVAPGENPLDLTLEPQAREVRGRVLAPNGTPVAGALLHPESACPERSVLRPHTAADGSFVIHLPAGTGRLVATLEGYSPGAVDVPGEKPVVGTVIRLTPDRGLSGRILGWEKGGVVTLERVKEPGQCGCGQCGFVALVEPDGRYRFSGLWPGEWVVTATVDGRILEGRVKLTPGAEGRMDLTLPPKLAVRGRVVDEEGQPIAGATVKLEQGPGPDSSGTSAADGTFVVRVESGTWTVGAKHEGFIPTSSEPVEVAAPMPREIELVMARGAVLRVRVRGLPKGQVVQYLWASGLTHPTLYGKADGEGISSISGLEPGDWTVTAVLGAPPLPTNLNGQRLAAVSKQVTIGPETRELAVDLAVPQGGLTFSGHIVDPLERVVTIILKHRGDPEFEFYADPAPDEPFRFSGLPAGSYLLKVEGARIGYKAFEQEVELGADREDVLHLPYP
jgi:protocatechuate 3,4-dioxygenase beta subunit